MKTPSQRRAEGGGRVLILEGEHLLDVVSQGLVPPRIGSDVHQRALVRCQCGGHLLPAAGFLPPWRGRCETKCFQRAKARQERGQRKVPDPRGHVRKARKNLMSFHWQTVRSGSGEQIQIGSKFKSASWGENREEATVPDVEHWGAPPIHSRGI